MLGASQIKLMAGGSVASLYDPLDSTQFTERELRAAVEAADDWGTDILFSPQNTPNQLRQLAKQALPSSTETM